MFSLMSTKYIFSLRDTISYVLLITTSRQNLDTFKGDNGLSEYCMVLAGHYALNLCRLCNYFWFGLQSIRIWHFVCAFSIFDFAVGGEVC